MQTCRGDLLSVTKGFILQQVNARGAMNSGVAKAIRDKYPQVWDDYSKVILKNCADPSKYLGAMILSRITDELAVVSIVGQLDYRGYGNFHLNYRFTSYDALDHAFSVLPDAICDAEFADIPREFHFPLLGCDRGGGNWDVVSAIINNRLKNCPKTLWLL